MVKFLDIDPYGSIGPVYRKLLYDILMLGLHNRVLEIGCLKGYSTSAFLEARERQPFDLSLCDPWMSDEVIELCKQYPGTVIQIKKPSLETHFHPYDLIFVDGDHGMENVAWETWKLLQFQPKTIIAHDTYQQEKKWFGPNLLRMAFENHRGYHVLQNHSARCDIYDPPVGFSMFTRCEQVYKAALPLFEGLPNEP